MGVTLTWSFSRERDESVDEYDARLAAWQRSEESKSFVPRWKATLLASAPTTFADKALLLKELTSDPDLSREDLALALAESWHTGDSHSLYERFGLDGTVALFRRAGYFESALLDRYHQYFSFDTFTSEGGMLHGLPLLDHAVEPIERTVWRGCAVDEWRYISWAADPDRARLAAYWDNEALARRGRGHVFRAVVPAAACLAVVPDSTGVPPRWWWWDEVFVDTSHPGVHVEEVALGGEVARVVKEATSGLPR